MFKYFLKRLLVMIPKLLLISMAVFFAMELLPGDVVTRSIDPELLGAMTEQQIEALKEAKGLYDPAYIRYFRWLADIFKGDFGYSLNSGSSIAQLVASRLPATLELAAFGLIISTIFGILLGFISAIKKNSPLDYSCTVFGMVGISVPEFFVGMLFILLFAIQLKWLPTGGRPDAADSTLWGYMKHMILPSISLAIALIATLMRYTRSCMLDVMGKDYIKTARAKGLRETTVYIKHCFRNGCAPVMILLIGRLSMLIAGTTIIETIYNYPGMGSLFLSAVSTSDTPVALTLLLLTSATALVCTFLADIVLAALDPRVRFGEE